MHREPGRARNGQSLREPDAGVLAAIAIPSNEMDLK